MYLLPSMSMTSCISNSPSRAISGSSHQRPVIQWKSYGVTVISMSAMWKVWVASHHLSAKDSTKMALAWLSSNRWITGSKPVARMKAFVSSIKTLYHEAMWMGKKLKKELK